MGVFSITIGGVDRTTDIIANTLVIEDNVNDKVNTCDFSLIDRSGNGFPDNEDEIIITLESGQRAFGGYVVTVDINQYQYGTVSAMIRCVDYTRDLDRTLAHISYENKTDKEIIEDLVNTYCAGSGITTTNVVTGVTISKIVFNYVQLSQALRKIADLTGRNWYIDYNKDIHYFSLLQEAAPLSITDSSANIENLTIRKDSSQLKNRVYVRGGTELSDFTTYSSKGDGVKTQFVLPDKPHEVSITVNGVSKTVGIKNVDTSGYDWYVNFQEKYVEQDAGGAVLSTSDTLVVTYKYDIPILVAVEDTDSIIDNGVHEFSIIDKQIPTTQAARDRATAELTDYATNIVEGSLKTYVTAIKAGQYIPINRTDFDVNDNYIIQRVRATSKGDGKFEYTVSIASAKTMGIIRFLIELLESNRNIVELDPNEVVDELFPVTDSLSTPTESLTDTVASPPFQYGTAKYGLAEYS